MSDLEREEGKKPGWIEVRLGGPLGGLEVFADYLNDFGAGGAVFSEDPESPGSEMVTGFIPLDRSSPELIEKLRARAKVLSEDFPGRWGTLEVTEIRDRDWVEDWKKKLEPLRLEPGVWIVPTFKDVPPHPPSEPVIRFDPGMAFGTGRHPTTSNSLRLMASGTKGGKQSVLDLGTGSGLLAIAAALWGASRVLALEIDGHALQVARENAALNEVEDKVELRQGVSGPETDLGESFEMIVANLYAEGLVKLMPFIARHLESAGTAVLSGILSDREEIVLQAANENGMQVDKREEEEGWVTLAVKHGAERN
jgi:ribosomal protein L11 methyltransferase